MSSGTDKQLTMSEKSSLTQPDEYYVANVCNTVWSLDNKPNHICGLLEEAVEVARASQQLSEEECLTVLKAIVLRVYAQPASTTPDVDLHNELVDVTIMCNVVRQQTDGVAAKTTLQKAAVERAALLLKRFVRAPKAFEEKMMSKRAAGIRI